MFERYTESARRVIFFARYETSSFGSTSIETEHLLLGLIRESKPLLDRWIPAIETIREEVERSIQVREKVSTSIDLPLSSEGKRILAYSFEEAERLQHRNIGVEHLLLGILRVEECFAAQMLYARGARLETIREELAREPAPSRSAPFSGAPPYGLSAADLVPDASTAQRIAEAVWIPVFGLEAVEGQKPFQTELKRNIWVVTGTA